MSRLILFFVGIALLLGAGGAMAGPQDDMKAFQDHFKKRFPNVEHDEFANGLYAINESLRAQWEDIEDFPPYELAIDDGEELFHKPFANGKGYADCFPKYKEGIKQNYPYFDTKQGQVVTLELAINQCREANGEKPLKYKKGAITSIGAYLAFLSRGKITNVVIPDDPRALAAYEKGKQFYYTKRGQLNFSCANCHVDSPGMWVRADQLSPALGQSTNWPVYRLKWGGMGTIHRRYGGCNGQVRAKGMKAQGEEYRNLEYFHTFMSNGVPLNGPSSRR